jgi:DNA-binding NarL/FixJ family response regulator
LSPHEREVLILLAYGYTDRQIDDQISLSVKTVKTYRAQIVERLESHDWAELIQHAHESGTDRLFLFHCSRKPLYTSGE